MAAAPSTDQHDRTDPASAPAADRTAHDHAAEHRAAPAGTAHERTDLPVVAIVLAGGSGSRAGGDVPKQFVRVAGRPVLAHTLAAFQGCDAVDAIVLVRPAAWADLTDTVLTGTGRRKVVAVVDGGADRSASTAAGLSAVFRTGVGECKVLVHDGVRPLVDERILRDCVRALDTADALDVVVAATDTIVAVDDAGTVVDVPRRAGLRRGQTPQGFLFSVLARAHALAAAEDELEVSDDCGLVRRFCPEVAITTVTGSEDNLKITHAQDLVLLDQLFRLRATAAGQLGGDPASLWGRVVVVLGGTRGIGAALVDALRDVGARPVVPRRDHGFDITDPASVHAVLAAAEAAHGSVDAVVVTAGVLEAGPTAQVPLEALRSVLRTNLWGSVVAARAAHPFLVRSRGQLLLFGSSSSTRGRAGYGVYSASKAAVVNLTQALADEWADDGVTVNCLSPGRTDTAMRRAVFGAGGDEALTAGAAAIASGADLLSPADVADAALRVLASRTTGSVVDVSAPLGERPAPAAPVGGASSAAEGAVHLPAPRGERVLDVDAAASGTPVA